jgi:hypothetical protein
MPARQRLSYANLMSTLAVVLALTTGTAYAAHLGKNAVKAKNIAGNAVQQRHIADNAVQGSDIGTGEVGSRAIADGGVAAGDLAGNSVNGAKIVDGSVGSADLGDNSVGSAEIGDNAVGSSEIANGSIGSGDLAANSVTDSQLAASSVGSSEIKDGSITAVDVAPDSISSTRMTEGVKNLLFNAGTLSVNKTFADVTVSNSSWPAGAPASGAQLSVTWTQPANTLDVISGFARLHYPAGCSQTSSTPRGLDVKIVDGGNRVISGSSAERTGGVNYNGNGFWSEQADLPGVTFRAPFGSDLAANPEDFVDYIHLPFELSEFVTDGSSASRTVRVFLKRNSASCSPEVTGARIVVLRYADQS